jgi:hypothetical protein
MLFFPLQETGEIVFILTHLFLIMVQAARLITQKRIFSLALEPLALYMLIKLKITSKSLIKNYELGWRLKSLGVFRCVPEVSKAHHRNVWNYSPDDRA